MEGGEEWAYRVLDVDVLPRVLQLFQAGEQVVEVFVGKCVVVTLGQVGGGLDDRGGLSLLWRLVIWGDAVAGGAVGDEAAGCEGVQELRRGLDKGGRRRNAGERHAGDTGGLQAAAGDPGKLGGT